MEQEGARNSNFQFRRTPAVPRKICDIAPENDVMVRITGCIIDKYGQTIVVDDGTGKSEVLADGGNVSVESLSSGDIVRVFSRVSQAGSGFELRAEIIQKISEEDAALMKKLQAP